MEGLYEGLLGVRFDGRREKRQIREEEISLAIRDD
jgi:hypothetical protein